MNNLIKNKGLKNYAALKKDLSQRTTTVSTHGNNDDVFKTYEISVDSDKLFEMSEFNWFLNKYNIDVIHKNLDDSYSWDVVDPDDNTDEEPNNSIDG